MLDSALGFPAQKHETQADCHLSGTRKVDLNSRAGAVRTDPSRDLEGFPRLKAPDRLVPQTANPAPVTWEFIDKAASIDPIRELDLRIRCFVEITCPPEKRLLTIARS
jgi:hypothetical protein